MSSDGDDLHVAAPQLRFLTGKPLDRLKDGLSVLYLSQLTLSLDNWSTVMRRVPDRFVVSYDIWEDKFEVSMLGTAPRKISHLSASGAEAWCLDNLAISASGLAAISQFWLRLDLRVADPREESLVTDSGLSLTRLVEIFSRQPRSLQPHWNCEAGPLQLANLKRIRGRGPRPG